MIFSSFSLSSSFFTSPKTCENLFSYSKISIFVPNFSKNSFFSGNEKLSFIFNFSSLKSFSESCKIFSTLIPLFSIFSINSFSNGVILTLFTKQILENFFKKLSEIFSTFLSIYGKISPFCCTTFFISLSISSKVPKVSTCHFSSSIFSKSILYSCNSANKL